MKPNPSPADIMRDARNREILRLRLYEGLTLEAIAKRMNLSVSQVHRMCREALARQRGDYDIERHRDEVYADTEAVLERLRPFVTDMPMPPDARQPDKTALAAFFNAQDQKVKLLGLNAPATTQAIPVDNATVDNPEAAQFLAELGAWAREANVINVGGFNPPLPPGVTKRVSTNQDDQMNGHGELDIHDRSMWSRMLKFAE